MNPRGKRSFRAVRTRHQYGRRENGTVPPACDQMKRIFGKTRRIAAEGDTCNGARRIGAVLNAARRYNRN